MPEDVALSPPTVVCITPVRNERDHLGRFLACAGEWADHIIVLDQCSTDGSRELAAAHPKVRLIVNDDPTYDEHARQTRLLQAAREIPGRRVVMALDADEALSANVLESDEWRAALSAAPATVLRLRWANLLPGCRRAWIPPEPIPFGFVDDGRDHRGPAIHSPRIPAGEDQPSLTLEDVRVLHYQYAAWERMKSKQRWYQCWERVHHPSKRPIQLYRQYHLMDAIPEERVHPVEPSWFQAYAARGVDMTAVVDAPWHPWDEDVLDWLLEFGPAAFARLDIWQPDYEALARRLNRSTNGVRLSDPRGPGTRLAHRWLARTQRRAGERPVRLAQRLLIPFGW
jgi:glycosyltransferase involved in cell wall biosynthesis